QQKLADYQHFRDHAKELQDRADLLRFQLNELNELKPVADELAELEQEHKRLSNVDSLLSQGQQALAGLSESDASLVDRAQHVSFLLQDMSADDASLKEVLELVDSARIQLEEAASS